MARITLDVADTEAREAIEHMPQLPHDPTAALDEIGKPRFLAPFIAGFEASMRPELKAPENQNTANCIQIY